MLSSELSCRSASVADASNPVASLVLSPTSIPITLSETAQLKATLRNTAGEIVTGEAVSWVSSNRAVATVSSSGLVTGRAIGATVITATSGGGSGSANVIVVPTNVSCALVDGTNPRNTSAFAKPGYLQPVTEPDFGTRITRVGGDPGTPIGGGVSGRWGQEAKHNYSKDPVWSADEGLIVLKDMSGVPTPGAALFVDGTTYQPLFSRGGPPGGGGEWRLHPTLPDVVVYVTGAGGVGHWNPRTNVTTPKFSVRGYTGGLMGPWEGNVSYDGRYAVVTATRTADNKQVAYVVDIDGGTKYPDIDLAAQGITNLDWVSVSALGGYVVALGTINGLSQRAKVFTKSGALVGDWSDLKLGHFDLGVDAAGNEVAFGGAASGTYAKRIIMRRLADGVLTPLTEPVSFNWHASTRNNKRPGWGYITTNDATGSVFDMTVWAIKLDESGTVERLAHHRTNQTDYDASAFAVPSPDGRRVMFASNWGDASGRPVQAYVIDTRQICPNGLPR